MAERTRPLRPSRPCQCPPRWPLRPRPPPWTSSARRPPASPSLHEALPVDEWKVVTILWCALVVPAVPGAQRCLQTWQCQLHTLQELVRHEAQGYGGLVRVVGGESVLSVFGAPVAQEDHA